MLGADWLKLEQEVTQQKRSISLAVTERASPRSIRYHGDQHTNQTSNSHLSDLEFNKYPTITGVTVTEPVNWVL